MTTMEKAEAAYNAIKVLAEHVGAPEARRLLKSMQAGLDPVEDVLAVAAEPYDEDEKVLTSREQAEAAYAAIAELARREGPSEARRLLLSLQAGLDPVSEVLSGASHLYTEAELEEEKRASYDTGFEEGERKGYGSGKIVGYGDGFESGKKAAINAS